MDSEEERCAQAKTFQRIDDAFRKGDLDDLRAAVDDPGGVPVPGASARTDVDDVLRLLLSSGADPNQRGINDYTPLHMAVAERNLLAVQTSARPWRRSGLAHPDRRV